MPRPAPLIFHNPRPLIQSRCTCEEAVDILTWIALHNPAATQAQLAEMTEEAYWRFRHNA